MPFVGLGLHVLVALFFAVHAIRNGQPLYWLIILFSFPMLGSAVYFFAIYLPNSRLQRGAHNAVVAAGKALDPGRELRESRAAFDYTPTAQNQMRLANALLEAGSAAEAAASFEACLSGPFASDPDIRLGAARAWLQCGKSDQALVHLQKIRSDTPDFRGEEMALWMAKALAAAGRNTEAQAEFEAGVARYGSFELKAEYTIWAAEHQQPDTAKRLHAELAHSMQRWSRHNHTLNAPLLRRLKAAMELV
jgi:hypothetical protein